MKDNNPYDQLSEDQQKLLDSITPSKIILPIIIGLAVIGYIVWRQLKWEDLEAISWDSHAVLWIAIAVGVYILRHLLIAWRLRILSEYQFSWKKSIELVFILEFASAVSPTNFGGSAVGFFMLIQESISGARATAIMVYTIVADTLIFVITLPLLAIAFGMIAFRPDLLNIDQFDGLGTTLLIVWIIMAAYGLILLYGLFIQPKHLSWLLKKIGNIKLFGKSRHRIIKAAQDIEITAVAMREKSWEFHAHISWMTMAQWILRFFSISAILVAFSPDLLLGVRDHIILLSRGESLYAVTAYSPTPGGSGVAELIFSQFYSDYIENSIAVLSAIFWRTITYYPYLFLGVIIIPNWIRTIINKRRKEKVPV